MAVTGVGILSVNKAAYEQLAYFALRPEMVFDRFATVKSHNLGPVKGTSVTFTINNDLPEQTTPLTDGVDLTPITMSDSQVTVTLYEYGAAIKLTAQNKQTAFYQLNPVAANEIGFNAGATMDTVAANAAIAGTKVAFSGGVTSLATLTKAAVLAGSDIRAARAYLKKNHVQKWDSAYAGLVFPDVVYDITGTTGGSGWLDPHVYGQNQTGIWDATIGNFNGVNFLEVDRNSLLIPDQGVNTFTISTISVSGNTATLTTSATHGLAVGNTLTISGATATSGTGSTSQVGFNAQFTVLTAPSTTTLTVDITGKTATCNPGTVLTLVVTSVDAYYTLIMGQQALAKAFTTGDGYGDQPIMGDTPVVDAAERITGVYWKHFAGYAVFRQQAMYRIASGSALGN